MTRPLTLLVAAEEAAGLQLLQALAKTPHRIAAVLASGRAAAGTSVRQAAEAAGLRVLPAERVRDPAFAETIRAEGVDLMLNAHSLHIVCPAVLEAPRFGAWNLHPGPLPRYAGLNAPSWAIFRGESRHAVTVHRMAAEIDAGPIAYEAPFPIGSEDAALHLYVKCTRLGVPLMLRLVEAFAADPAGPPLRPMLPMGRQVFGRKPPNGGRVDWDWPAETVAAFVRACDFGPFPSPWGAPLALLDGQEVGLSRTRPGRGGRTGAVPGTVLAVDGIVADIACGDGSVLVSQLVIDGRRQPAGDVLSPGRRLAGRSLHSQPVQVPTP